jgi:disulfide bond formation protein DsbB
VTPLQLRALGPAVGSALLLAAALAFQYLGGLAPCPLCLLQRWPHAAAVVLGLAILAWPRRGLAVLAGLAMLGGAGIGLYHAGIERDWRQGPTTCTAPVAGAVAPGELLDRILEAPVVACDAVAWSWLGVSMAGWNAILSLVLAVLWFRAARAQPGG